MGAFDNRREGFSTMVSGLQEDVVDHRYFADRRE
jgi:hypothetical protein